MKTMRMLGLMLCCTLVLSACDAKDECLDGGGHYNEQTKQCEK
ncbi:hypothetical protein [Moraxella nasovis]|nr:hypothetical protein [Moraxella nasovis]